MAELDSASAVFVPLQAGSAGCVHRWRISTPVGDMCAGNCSLCGAERVFTNERHPFGQPLRARRVPTAKSRSAAPADHGMLLRLIQPEDLKPENTTG